MVRIKGDRRRSLLALCAGLGASLTVLIVRLINLQGGPDVADNMMLVFTACMFAAVLGIVVYALREVFLEIDKTGIRFCAFNYHALGLPEADAD